jgi:hypothetical protein
METTTTHEEQQPVQLHTIISGAADRLARSVFIFPAVLALLFLSIFPLLASLYVSLTKFDIAPGGFKLTFVGLNNYKKLFVGSEGTHFLGKFAPSTFLTWLVFGVIVIALAVFLARYVGAYFVERRAIRDGKYYACLCFRRDLFSIHFGLKSGDADSPTPARATLFSGGIFAPDDDHASRRCLHVSNAYGYK